MTLTLPSLRSSRRWLPVIAIGVLTLGAAPIVMSIPAMSTPEIRLNAPNPSATAPSLRCARYRFRLPMKAAVYSVAWVAQ